MHRVSCLHFVSVCCFYGGVIDRRKDILAERSMMPCYIVASGACVRDTLTVRFL